MLARNKSKPFDVVGEHAVWPAHGKLVPCQLPASSEQGRHVTHVPSDGLCQLTVRAPELGHPTA